MVYGPHTSLIWCFLSCVTFLYRVPSWNWNGTPYSSLILVYRSNCICVEPKPLMTSLLSSVCCADESISNDKMRLTLNLEDNALHPTGHPLVLVIFIAPQQKCRQAEVIVFRVNMMWLASNVCGNKWAVLPWEINSIGVNTDDWDGHCEARVSQAGNVWVPGVCCLWIHTTGSLTCELRFSFLYF